MMAETGMAALWLAAAMSLLQLLLGALTLAGGRRDLASAVAPVAVAQALLASVAFLCLIAVFLRSDMSVLLVATNSHSAKPWLYKLAGSWGNHEGSMLLWVTILAVAGAAVALFERTLRADTKLATLATQGGIALGFYAFLLFSSNPFTRLLPAPADGQGLNPLLQDPGLAFHPPTLYIGYVGMSVAFSFAIGALLTRNVTPEFARAMRPWILGAWVFLTIGITAGSYWAYYELGWGGWWFWDPVENASLMPWLAATALLHSVSVLATRDALRAWTIMLSVLAFSMAMMGTFLVRSGILTSVHSFAADPRRGLFILALLLLYIGGALALFGWRIGTVSEGKRFDPVSREGALVINNLLLSVILVIVLVGTLYPLVLEATTGTKISVGAPYFNAAAGPVALVLLVMMAVGPLIRWRRDHPARLLDRTALPILILACAGLAVALSGVQASLLSAAGLILSPAIAAASLAPLWKRNLARTPLFTYGMVLAHLGCAVSMFGMASDSVFTKENMVAMAIGDRQSVGPFTLALNEVRDVPGPNYRAVEAVLVAEAQGRTTMIMLPQLRRFASPEMETNEAAITTFWDGQLYIVLGEAGDDGRWIMRMWWKPFVTLIWAGGAIIALGGALSLFGRVRRSALRRKTGSEVA